MLRGLVPCATPSPATSRLPASSTGRRPSSPPARAGAIPPPCSSSSPGRRRSGASLSSASTSTTSCAEPRATGTPAPRPTSPPRSASPSSSGASRSRELRRAGESLESAARRLRYESLLALGRDLGPGTLLATGHTLEDQAETVLLHLERRLGRSRGGVRARRSDGVVRPLLPFRREELRDFLRAEGIPWREDASNADERFARNRVRHRVLPGLETRWPGVTARLARAAEALTRRLDGIDARVDAALASHAVPLEGPWPRALLTGLDRESAGRLLVRAAGGDGRRPGRAQVDRVLDRLAAGEPAFREAFAGRRIAADRLTVRLTPPARLVP